MNPETITSTSGIVHQIDHVSFWLPSVISGLCVLIVALIGWGIRSFRNEIKLEMLHLDSTIRNNGQRITKVEEKIVGVTKFSNLERKVEANESCLIDAKRAIAGIQTMCSEREKHCVKMFKDTEAKETSFDNKIDSLSKVINDLRVVTEGVRGELTILRQIAENKINGLNNGRKV